MRILAIDSGNTRIKWGLREGDAWVRVGVLTHDEIDALEPALAALSRPDRVAVANVAGAGVEQRISRACAGLSAPMLWAQGRPQQCGVVNQYEQPAQLGVDRWAALIGAWRRLGRACLVVGAGTATTMDHLSSQGEFLGGVIVPGLALMKRSLAENTAQLPFAEGAFNEHPRNTADAIETGVLHAQAGAIERMHARLATREGGKVECLLSGGAAATIARCLDIPHLVADHLVLDGLAHMAGDAA